MAGGLAVGEGGFTTAENSNKIIRAVRCGAVQYSISNINDIRVRVSVYDIIQNNFNSAILSRTQ